MRHFLQRDGALYRERGPREVAQGFGNERTTTKAMIMIQTRNRNRTMTGAGLVSASLLSLALLCGGGVSLHAQDAGGIRVENVSMGRGEDGLMTVTMDLRLGDLRLDGNHTAVFVPMLVHGTDTRALSPVSVYGRNRWYRALRSGDDVSGGMLHSARPAVLPYRDAVPYEAWMDGALLELRRSDYGCCGDPAGESGSILGTYAEPAPAPVAPAYVPEFRYVRPAAEAAKVRSLSMRAYIDFPVNGTDLLPGFRNNRSELEKIVATIDSLRNDSDMSVESIVIRSSASPEGTYAANDRLAEGRAEALKRYVEGLYRFGAGSIVTEHVAEDWEGLREAVSAMELPHRAEILSLIDDPSLGPDDRERRIRNGYPEEYRRLREEVYPGLRRSDYRIEYSVRSYDDVETIRRVLSESPSKLSAAELYRLAETLEPGSGEHADVLETAARLYPGDETANLNAATAAMQRGDLEGAERYLSRAGGSAEAEYARGILSRLKEESARTDR